MSLNSPPVTAVEADRRFKHFTYSFQAMIAAVSVSGMVAAADTATIVAGGWLGQVIEAVGSDRHGVDWYAVTVMTLFASVLFMTCSCVTGLYSLPSLLQPARNCRRNLRVGGLVAVSLSGLVAVSTVGGWTWGLLLGTGAALLAIGCFVRFVVADLIDIGIGHHAIAGRRVFLLGDAAEMDTLSAADLLREYGLQDVGRLALRSGTEQPPRWAAEGTAAAVETARVRGAAEFVVVLKRDGQAHLAQIEAGLRASPLPVCLMPSAEERSIAGPVRSSFGAGACLVKLQRAPLGRRDKAVKRMLDVVGASVAVVVLLPLMILTAAAIKLDSPGPIIFRQRRSGFDQRQFTIFKFRTMHVLDDGQHVSQARRGDTRITRIGLFLRRTSIDELPQLLNVLQGEMSLVGPRPHALAHDQAFAALIGHYTMRHRVKPGITGWAQIKGCRGETARPGLIERRVEHDLWYISHWSLRLDCRILLRTALDVVRHDAY